MINLLTPMAAERTHLIDVTFASVHNYSKTKKAKRELKFYLRIHMNSLKISILCKKIRFCSIRSPDAVG